MNLRSLPRSRPVIYGFALVCVALAGLVSWATGVILHIPAMLLPFTVAVAAAAWFGGLEGGLFATGVGTVFLFGLFRGIVFSMFAIRPGAPLLVTYCLIGAIVSLAIDRAVRDYTDLQRTKAELQRAIERLSETNKSLEQFARSASDALRTPLRAIGVFAELLLVRHATVLDNESKEYLRIMVSSVRDMNSAIDGLQEYARAKLPPPALLLIDSNSVLRQAIRNLESEILAAKAVIDRAGVGCEPASAASVAGVRQLAASGTLSAGRSVVAVLTGHMLKDPEILLQGATGTRIREIDPTLSALAAALQNPA